MVSSTLIKRLALVILAAILICSFVACKKKEPDVDVAPSSSNSGSVNSTVSVENDTKDEGDELNSSELDKLEGDTFGNTSSSFKPFPGTSSQSGTSSVPGYISNGPSITIPTTPSSSQSQTSSETPSTSSSVSSTEATSSEAPPTIPQDPEWIPDWF